jgi:hypothetical protein
MKNKSLKLAKELILSLDFQDYLDQEVYCDWPQHLLDLLVDEGLCTEELQDQVGSLRV